MFGGNDKNKMHPQDMRNMMIFFIIAGILYFTYDAYVLKPQAQALRQHRIAEEQLARSHAITVDPTKPALPREEVLNQAPRVKISNGKISGTISLEGARIDDIALDEYFETIEKQKQVMLLSPKDTDFPRHVAHGWVAEGNASVPNDKTLWRVQGGDTLTPETPVTLVWDNGQGQRFENIYSIDKDYVVTIVQKITNNSAAPVTLHPYGLVSQTGLYPNFAPVWVVHEGPIGFMGGELHQAAYGKMRKEPLQEFTGASGWAGITDKYWLTGLIPPQGQEVRYRYNYSGIAPKKHEKDTSRYQVDYTAAAVDVAPAQSAQVESHIYAGAKKVMLLEDYEEKLNVPNLDLAVDFGWFWFLSKPFFFALHFLAEHSNIAIAMILLTILIRGAVFPLTNLSYRSFAKMKKVAPQVAELRKFYGGDKVRLQEELVKLYEREGVNPMSGCLPMMVQIPIFFALYKVLITTIEMRQAPFFGWIHDMSAPDPTNIFNLFGLIPWDPPQILHIGIWPCLMLVGMLIQRKLNPPPQDPIQRDMALYFPFLMTYLMAGFSSGLVIYWTLSAYLGILQQVIIMRQLGVPIYLFGEAEAEKEIEQQVAEGGPAVHPLMAMAEKDAEEALFGDDDDTPKSISAPKPRRKKKK